MGEDEKLRLQKELESRQHEFQAKKNAADAVQKQMAAEKMTKDKQGTVETLTKQKDSLAAQVETLKQQAKETKSNPQTGVLELHRRKIDELEVKNKELQTKLDRAPQASQPAAELKLQEKELTAAKKNADRALALAMDFRSALESR